MSAFGFRDGIRQSARAKLANSNATTIFSCPVNKRLHLVGVLLLNQSASTVNPIVDIYDGSTAFVIRDNADLTDTTRELLNLPGDFMVMQEGDALRVTAAANVFVYASYIDPYQNAGGRG